MGINDVRLFIASLVKLKDVSRIELAISGKRLDVNGYTKLSEAVNKANPELNIRETKATVQYDVMEVKVVGLHRSNNARCKSECGKYVCVGQNVVFEETLFQSAGTPS